MTRHALVVPFPELAPAVDAWRERTCRAKPSHGVPPHVTLLFPAPEDVHALCAALAQVEPFDVEFKELGRFPDVLWLAPDPVVPLRELVERLTAAFPEFPLEGGPFPEIVPHLTVAQAQLDRAESEVEPLLPLRGRADAAVLLQEHRPDRWSEVARFAFEAA